MKMILNIEGNPNKDDVIVFQNGKWVCIPKGKFLEKTEKEMIEVKKEFEKLQTNFNDLKNSVNEKLKSYHNILQVLTKEK